MLFLELFNFIRCFEPPQTAQRSNFISIITLHEPFVGKQPVGIQLQNICNIHEFLRICNAINILKLEFLRHS